jgi:hypothetical protein
LENLSFFGITEYQKKSQMLFEEIFKGLFKFGPKIEQSSSERSTKIFKKIRKRDN